MAKSKAKQPDEFEAPFPPPHWLFSEWQREVWNETLDLGLPKTIWMNCGRGAGKDILAIRCVIRDALKLYLEKKNAPKVRGLVLNPIVKVWLLAPSDHALVQTRRDFEGELRDLAAAWELPDEDLWHHHRRDCSFSIFGKSEIEIHYQVTSRKDSLRGPGVDLCLYTEFAAETREAAFREELKGTLTRAGRLGRLYAYSTPKGPQGLFYEECKRVAGGEHELAKVQNRMIRSEDGLEIYAHADSLQNDFLTDHQRAQIAAEKVDGCIYDQERGAKFVVLDKGGSVVYPREIIAKNFAHRPPDKRGRNYVVGVDISRLGDDWTVFVVLDYDAKAVVRVERYQKTTGPEIVSHMERIAKELGQGGTEFLMDATSHQAFIKDFCPRYLRVTELKVYDKDKERMVLGLRFLMDLGKVTLPDPDRWPFKSEAERDAAKVMHKELLQFTKVVDSRGRIRYSAPPGAHDDTVCALYQACDPIARSLMQEGLPDVPKEFRALIGL